ncbi:hypothetical protein ACEPAF_6407 [Sanghuangporus sanghuang]
MSLNKPRLRSDAANTPPISPPLSPTVSSSSVSPYSPVHRRTQPPKSQIPGLPRRLLVPTSCPKRVAPDLQLRPVKSKTSSNRLTRSRADSAPPEPAQTEVRDQRRWFNCDSRFEVVEEDVKIAGYQIFAVEKWIVERRRAAILLTVYTGDPKDVITVTALAPSSCLSNGEAHQEWEKVIHELRKDGARPRETDKGIIMITSLANFRSDYTVVYIPDGEFLAHRQQLYVNINLLRLGCSGRSALTLQEPSDATKDRFISMFHFGDVTRTGDRFGQTVLELVRIIQCGLSLFDMFPIDFQEQDGLLCDETVNGIQKWVAEIGEQYMKIEPTERVADPSIVSALITLSLSMRNKLSAIGFQAVPKDPFFQPRQFTRCLAAFVNQRLAQAPSPTSTPCPAVNHAYLNLTLIKVIDSAYDKYRSTEPYKLHRVVLNKIDDFTSATQSAMSSSRDASHSRSMSLSLSKDREAEVLVECTSDLANFVNRIDFLHKKDYGASIRYLWTGKFDQLERKKQESLQDDMDEDKERERERSDSDYDGDVLSVLPWSNKVTKKIENWAGEFGRNKLKRTSVDLSKDKSPESLHGSTVAIPSVVISREPDGAMSGPSSGRASPVSPSASYQNLSAFSSAHTSGLAIDDLEYSQRVAQFNKDWPSPVVPVRKRVYSWADQLSANKLRDEVEVDVKAMEATVFPFGIQYDPNVFPWTRQVPAPAATKQPRVKKPKEPFVLKRKRSHSFDDREFLDPNNILSREHMKTDVDLCIQCLIMHRRKAYIQASIALLQALIQSSSSSNEMLMKCHEEHAAILKELEEKCQIAANIEENVSVADSISADTEALMYEASFLDTAGLWRMAQAPRLRVFTIRDRIFGVRSRRRFGLPGDSRDRIQTHGRFNRVQKRIDGRERLVDILGRTESDVEEEGELPENVHFESEEDSEEEADMHGHPETETVQEGRFQAMSDWLLTLFTKWGRVSGVRGAEPLTSTEATSDTIQPKKDESNHEESSTHVSSSPEFGSHEVIYKRPTSFRRPGFPGNGHPQRLSTVGEEDEPSTGPNTPTISGLPSLLNGH